MGNPECSTGQLLDKEGLVSRYNGPLVRLPLKPRYTLEAKAEKSRHIFVLVLQTNGNSRPEILVQAYFVGGPFIVVKLLFRSGNVSDVLGVLYLLHGSGQPANRWADPGSLQQIITRYLTSLGWRFSNTYFSRHRPGYPWGPWQVLSITNGQPDRILSNKIRDTV